MDTDDGFIHPAWSRVLARAQTSGLFSDLDESAAHELLGRAASAAPRPSAVGRLIERYYGAAGNEPESVFRQGADGLVLVRANEAPTRVIAHIGDVLVGFDDVAVSVTPEALTIEQDGEVATASKLVRHARVKRLCRKVAASEPRHVVRALNVLAARRGEPNRFVGLAVGERACAFLLTDDATARDLYFQQLSAHKSRAELAQFAGWTIAVPDRSRRSRGGRPSRPTAVGY